VTAVAPPLALPTKDPSAAVQMSADVVQFAMTNKEAAEAAAKLGYRKTNDRCHGQAVFTNGRLFISADVDGHNGGVWKMADSPENLRSKKTRMGTYDANLNRVGD
jgi:hypothetical protein